MAAEFSVDPSLIETGGVIIVDGARVFALDQWNVRIVGPVD